MGNVSNFKCIILVVIIFLQIFGDFCNLFLYYSFLNVFKIAEAASELGSKEEVISKLVEWCNTEDHPGVQGEANRLLARIIKNSRYV